MGVLEDCFKLWEDGDYFLISQVYHLVNFNIMGDKLRLQL